MKMTQIAGCALLGIGLVLGVLHFTASQNTLGAAGGAMLAGVVVLFASKCGG